MSKKSSTNESNIATIEWRKTIAEIYIFSVKLRYEIPFKSFILPHTSIYFLFILLFFCHTSSSCFQKFVVQLNSDIISKKTARYSVLSKKNN